MPTGYTEIAGSAPSPKPGVLSINDFMGMHIFDRNDYIERLLSKSKMVDLKNFLKKEYIPRKLAGMSWTMWYKRFTMHALIHGIYVPPYESLIKGSIMGAWFDDLPEAFQERKLSWSYRIIQVLTNQHTIPDGPELTTLQRFESGYAALHHIMYSHHPRLTYNSSNEIVPTQKCGETVPSYIARWTEFLIFQHVMGTPWAPIRAVECIINNLPSPHNTWIHSQFQLECYVFSNDKSILPPAYTMGQIAKTIEDLMNTNPYQHFDDSPAIEDDDDITPQNR